MKNIVFVEGVSGVGKTTTTTLLGEKLRNMGYSVNCYLEGDHDNPLDPFNGSYPPEISQSLFTKTYLQCWRDFAKNPLINEEMLVLDGTLLHHQINDLVRIYGAPDDYIVNHLTGLLNAIQALNPIILYLLSHHVGCRLTQAHVSRKQSIPTKERIAFYMNRKRIDLFVLNRLTVESHVFSIDDGWNAAIEKMTEYVRI